MLFLWMLTWFKLYFFYIDVFWHFPTNGHVVCLGPTLNNS